MTPIIVSVFAFMLSNQIRLYHYDGHLCQVMQKENPKPEKCEHIFHYIYTDKMIGKAYFDPERGYSIISAGGLPLIHKEADTFQMLFLIS